MACLGHMINNGRGMAVTHMTQTAGHRIKWDHLDILATRQSDIHCKIRETLADLRFKPALYENVGSEKLLLY